MHFPLPPPPKKSIGSYSDFICDLVFSNSSIHSFNQEVVTQCPLCARHCFRCRGNSKELKKPGSSRLMQDILVLDKGTNKKNVFKEKY